ncbi:MAG TPA: hypothetical protein GXZ64_07530 [Clostridiaceae bacterium]|jgi:hypothetical protein|nr:hypothetical protein [Clostridiaceae bacterium]
MPERGPIVGLFEDNEDAAKAIEMLVERGYTEEDIYVMTEDPEYFADALEEAKALIERGVPEEEADSYVKHLKVGDVLVVVDPNVEHYSETLDIVRQVSEQAQTRCHCRHETNAVERVVDYLGQKLFHKKSEDACPTHMNERGETICDVCGGLVTPDAEKQAADRIVRDYMGQPLFRKKDPDIK